MANEPFKPIPTLAATLSSKPGPMVRLKTYVGIYHYNTLHIFPLSIHSLWISISSWRAHAIAFENTIWKIFLWLLPSVQFWSQKRLPLFLRAKPSPQLSWCCLDLDNCQDLCLPLKMGISWSVKHTVAISGMRAQNAFFVVSFLMSRPGGMNFTRGRRRRRRRKPTDST